MTIRIYSFASRFYKLVQITLAIVGVVVAGVAVVVVDAGVDVDADYLQKIRIYSFC